jgi:hypothetical protein
VRNGRVQARNLKVSCTVSAGKFERKEAHERIVEGRDAVEFIELVRIEQRDPLIMVINFDLFEAQNFLSISHSISISRKIFQYRFR